MIPWSFGAFNLVKNRNLESTIPQNKLKTGTTNNLQGKTVFNEVY